MGESNFPLNPRWYRQYLAQTQMGKSVTAALVTDRRATDRPGFGRTSWAAAGPALTRQTPRALLLRARARATSRRVSRGNCFNSYSFVL